MYYAPSTYLPNLILFFSLFIIFQPHESYFRNLNLEFWPRWRCRQKPFTSSHNQKEDNNQSKINKYPEVPENQTAWNSDNQGIKETVNQNNQTGKAAEGEKPR